MQHTSSTQNWSAYMIQIIRLLFSVSVCVTQTSFCDRAASFPEGKPPTNQITQGETDQTLC